MGNVLITSGGRRVSLVKAFKNELRKIFPKASVLVVDAFPELSAAAQVADKYFTVSKIQEEGYIEELLRICHENEVKLIIPTIDTELLLLSKHRNEFLEQGIHVVISDERIIEIAHNKKESHNFFEEIGIQVARIYSKKNYIFPIFIKPFDGWNSMDNYIIKDENDFTKNHFLNNRLLFFEYIDHELYNEYTCDLYYNKNGVLKCAIPRMRIEVRAGEVNKAVTKKNTLNDLIKKKLGVLKGARGCITVQFFVHKTNNSIIGIEINPRFGGGYPLAYLSGGNFPKWLIEEYLLGKEISFCDTWEENLLMLRYDDEILINRFRDEKSGHF
ncbi:MAG: ATP-grasp domain-containing protein [Flavobacteriaceae bacterium]